MLHIKLFPAEYGDCIILSIGKESQYNILVDYQRLIINI